MHIKNVLILLALSSQLLSGCTDSNESGSNLSGIVIDAYTDEPVSGVTVSIIEDGAETITDSNGSFSFSEEDMANTDQIISDGANTFALSFVHADFRPREANITLGISESIEISPQDVPTYFYHAPVQLNDDIETGELSEANMNAQGIQNLMDKIYRDNFDEIHSVLIYRNNTLVLEEYLYGNNDTINFEGGILVDTEPAPIQWSRNDEHYVASTNKALTSILMGIALDEANVSITSPIAAHLPDYASYFQDEGKASITYEDCLTMQANLQWNEWGQPDLANMWKSDDFADFALSKNYLGAGTEWRYNSALPNILLKCIDYMVGGNVREWAHENFYGKLGITDYKWQSQPDGYPEGAARMYLRPRDMMKIGITLLNNGQWKNEQVIPEAYVQQCYDLKVTTPNTGDYSYYFWLRNLNGIDYLSAEGDGGNYINIVPSLGLVVVATQGLYLKSGLYSSQMNEIMSGIILSAAE